VAGRGEPRNLANGAAEFGKICRGKLWSLLLTSHHTARHKQQDTAGKVTSYYRLSTEVTDNKQCILINKST